MNYPGYKYQNLFLELTANIVNGENTEIKDMDTAENKIN